MVPTKAAQVQIRTINNLIKQSKMTNNTTSMCTRWAFNFSIWNPSESDILLATSCIQQEEKDRLSKFVFKKDVKSSLIGRLMLRKFVSESSNLPYNEINFVRDSKGKPLLSNNNPETDNLHYNVSHQGNFTVLAGTSNGTPLGVDVMKFERSKTRNLSEYFRIMSRTFAASEWETIRSAGSEVNQLEMFCRHWCLKESYLKAVGIGITINLQDVCFEIKSRVLSKTGVVNDTEVFFKGARLLDWEFQEMLLDDEHCIAVALNKRNVIEKDLFKVVQFDELVANAVPLLERDEEYCKKFFQKLDK